MKVEDMENNYGFSDLPRDLLSLIGKRLDTSVDVLRFRSVCRSWRSTLRKSDAVSLLSRLRLPCPYPYVYIGRNEVYLIRRIYYRFSPLRTWSSSSSSSTPPGWLAKVESTKFGEIRFRTHMLSSERYFGKPSKFLKNPRKANWLDLRFHEVARSYSLENFHIGCDVHGVTKVVLSPDSIWTNRTTSTIVAIYNGGTLGFAKHKGENWTLIDEQNFDYHDLIVYKEQILTVNRRGTVSVIDSSMKLIQFSNELASGNQIQLVECGGDLYAVEGLTGDFLRDSHLNPIIPSSGEKIGFYVFDRVPHSDAIAGEMDFEYFLAGLSSYKIGLEDLCTDPPYITTFVPSSTIIHFNVYRLIRKQGRWEEVRDLGDHAFLLGTDCCFSVSAPKSVGLERNCIYFTTKFSTLDRNNAITETFAYNLKERRIYENNMIRSAPIWLSN